MSVVERARIVRVPTEAQLERALIALLEAPAAPPGLSRRRSPGLRGRARSRFRIRTTPARAETPALAAGLPGSGSAAPRPRHRPTRGRGRGGPQDGSPAGGAPGSVASVDSTRVPSTPPPASQAKPDAPIADAGRHRHRRGRRAPMSLGSRVNQAVGSSSTTGRSSSRPSRSRRCCTRASSRPRTAACSRVRWPCSPSTSPPGTVVTNELRDVDQIRYIAPLDVGRLRAEDFGRPSTSPTSSPTASQSDVRVAVTRRRPRVTILDFQPRSIQVVLDEVDDQAGPGRRRAGADPRRGRRGRDGRTRRPRSRSRGRARP